MVKKKLTIEFIQSEFKKDGYKLLTDKYINAHQKLEYICPNGHKHSITWNKWHQGRRCPYCAGNAKKTIDIIKTSFEKEGYKLLTKEYINNEQKLDVICSNGHKYSISWSSWISGVRCVYCSKRPPVDIKFVKDSFAKNGYILLTDKYVHAHQKLEYICPNGHKHYIRWNDWQQGIRCPYCSGKIKKTIEFIRSELKKENYILLSTNYNNAHEKLTIKCPNGHLIKMSWHTWQKGNRCKYCSGKYKRSIELVKDEFLKEGYIILTDNYVNAHQILECICPNNHLYKVSYKNWKNKRTRCPRCGLRGISKQELNLSKFIDSICENVLYRDRNIISPNELDIVIPDKKLAIEYCGLYWHSELMGKNSKYHLMKLDKCKQKGYRLITIFEDELVYNKKIVFSRLKDILGVDEDVIKVYARDCVVKEINSSIASNFCVKNHLQGYIGSNVKLGLFYENDLISVMTFAKPSISKGSKYKENVWELSRFCSKINYRVVGGASKLLKYFERNYPWIEIFSYADRRWSTGNLYEKLGFNFDSVTKPNYWYLKGNKRIHRFALRKNNDDPKDQTEWQIRKSQGWNRIWDCGNLKYKKINY